MKPILHKRLNLLCRHFQHTIPCFFFIGDWPLLPPYTLLTVLIVNAWVLPSSSMKTRSNDMFGCSVLHHMDLEQCIKQRSTSIFVLSNYIIKDDKAKWCWINTCCWITLSLFLFKSYFSTFRGLYCSVIHFHLFTFLIENITNSIYIHIYIHIFPSRTSDIILWILEVLSKSVAFKFHETHQSIHCIFWGSLFCT